MAISLVKREGNYIKVCDRNGWQLCTIYNPSAQIVGWSDSTFTLKEGKILYVYDEEGSQISLRHDC